MNAMRRRFGVPVLVGLALAFAWPAQADARLTYFHTPAARNCCMIVTGSENYSATATRRPRVSLATSVVAQGGVLTVTGRFWPARSQVKLLIGPPASEATAVGSVRAGAGGKFTKRIRISLSAKPGKYVLLACRRACAVKASARFSITRRSVSPQDQTPAAPQTPTAPQVDPKERLSALMRGKKLVYFSASTVGDVSGSTERQIEFCTAGTFNYRYIYSGSYSFTEQHASGTWKVEEAVFDDAAGKAQGRISYISNNPDVLQSGEFILSIVGTKVYVDQTEYAVDNGSC